MFNSLGKRVLLLFLLAAGAAFGDDLVWTSAGSNVWSIYYVSPYQAQDKSLGEQLNLFCLDYNHDIAPPNEWNANLNPLVASGNASANLSKFQFGGSYPNVLPPGTTNANAFAFQSETYTNNASTVTADLTTSASFDRYLEAAWLFTQIENAIAEAASQTPPISQAQLFSIEQIYQVAAWRIFADSGPSNQSNNSHLGDLNMRIGQTAGRYTFNNLMGFWVRNDALANGYNDFQFAVDTVLGSAEIAVKNNNWLPTTSWDVVTADKDWVQANNSGVPLQEFLTPTPAPEPAAAVLFGTVLVLIGVKTRRKRP